MARLVRIYRPGSKNAFFSRRVRIELVITTEEQRRQKMQSLPTHMAWFEPLVCGCGNKVFRFPHTVEIPAGQSVPYFDGFASETMSNNFELVIVGLVHVCAESKFVTETTTTRIELVMERPSAPWFAAFKNK